MSDDDLVDLGPTGEFGGLSLPEEVQLAMLIGGGELSIAWAEASAAALLELALLGRIGSVPATGWFSKGEFKIEVRDTTPTGQPPLDVALQAIALRGRPWAPYSCIGKLGTRVGTATQDALIARGAIRRDEKRTRFAHRLWLADDRFRRAVMLRLEAGRLRPSGVTDVRVAALVDLMRNSSDRFSGVRGIVPTIEHEWYPAEIRDTAGAILKAEHSLAAGGSGGGYEG